LKAVDIVCGIIFKDDKFLIERRKKDEIIDPNLAVLPGGHVEENESKEQALKREMKEELDIKVKKSKFIKKDFWIASNGEKQNIYYYLILDYDGKPTCKAAEELVWIKNVKDLDTEVDRKVIEKLIK
jgi:mutator protein MutT